MAMEAWVVLREGVVGDLIMRAIAYDMMSSLQGRVSDFVYTRAPRRFGRNRALVVLASVTVPSTGLNDSAKKFAGSGSEDLIHSYWERSTGGTTSASAEPRNFGVLCPLFLHNSWVFIRARCLR